MQNSYLHLKFLSKLFLKNALKYFNIKSYKWIKLNNIINSLINSLFSLNFFFNILVY